MKRKLLALLLIGLLLAAGRAEEIFTAPVDEVPAELAPFDLAAPEATATPAPTLAPGALATLAPGSQGYPPEKVDFEDEVWSRLTDSWHLDAVHAAALMSSIGAESSFCPYNSQKYKGVDDRGRYTFSTGDHVGFGLCQWTFPERKRALAEYAQSLGSADLVWDFDVQMGFMRREIDLDGLMATATLNDATEWVVLHYENPSQRNRSAWPGTRYAQALDLYARHTGAAYDAPPLEFTLAAPDGSDAALGCESDGEHVALTVNSNYYWRVTADADWLDIRETTAGGAQPCAWGAAIDGEKRLVLAAKRPPIVPEATLRFEIFCGETRVRRVRVAYTGETLGEFWGKQIAGWLSALMKSFAAT